MSDPNDPPVNDRGVSADNQPPQGSSVTAGEAPHRGNVLSRSQKKKLLSEVYRFLAERWAIRDSPARCWDVFFKALGFGASVLLAALAILGYRATDNHNHETSLIEHDKALYERRIIVYNQISRAAANVVNSALPSERAAAIRELQRISDGEMRVVAVKDLAFPVYDFLVLAHSCIDDKSGNWLLNDPLHDPVERAAEKKYLVILRRKCNQLADEMRKDLGSYWKKSSEVPPLPFYDEDAPLEYNGIRPTAQDPNKSAGLF